LANSFTSYEQTTEWLFKQLPMYQNVGAAAYKKDLANSLELDEYLGHPHRSYRTIHVAGTNGKGSTCHILASVLQTAGYKVGLYTSPHLKDFRERIRINGKMISKEEVVEFVNSHKWYLEEHKLSFFEMTVGMAFNAFQTHKVDIAIIETGLGGRLDSTNIITPILSIITSIDKDHTDLLGNTLLEIAGEKAGIIKRAVPVLINEHRPRLRSFFASHAQSKNSVLSFLKVSGRPKEANTQLENELVVVKAFKILKQTDFKVNDQDIALGIQNTNLNTGFQGRFQVISDQPRIIVDVAHNPAGIKLLFKRIDQESFNQLHIVFGMVKGKSIAKVLTLLPTNAYFYLCEPNSERKLPVDVLVKAFDKFNYHNQDYRTTAEALQAAKNNAGKEDLILVTGSNFIVAEIL